MCIGTMLRKEIWFFNETTCLFLCTRSSIISHSAALGPNVQINNNSEVKNHLELMFYCIHSSSKFHLCTDEHDLL